MLVIMGPMCLTFPRYLIGCCGKEAGYRPADQSVSVLWIMSGALLLRSVDLFKSIDDCVKGFHIPGLPTGSVRQLMWTSVGSVHVVLVGFSPTGCTSIRIVATLGYE
jgi:hypothetical protein